MKVVDGAMLLLFEPPCATEIDNTQSARDRFRNEFPRGVVRCGQEQKFRLMLLQFRPRKWDERQVAVPGDMGEDIRQVTGLARLRAAPQQQGRVEPGMPGEDARQFQAGISGRTQHGCFEFGHQAAMPLVFKSPPQTHKYPSY
jgi:hypothetical protein